MQRLETTAGDGNGHPRGLYTLFFTEMWERFSYYGMRALLVLFMVDSERGGLALSDPMATAIYGLYTAGVYLAALPGGWIADRLLGARRSIWYGGIIIAAGHFTLAIKSEQAFYFGLVLIVIGTGLLKPNISALVGNLYPEGGTRRDAGFTIFYMGINIGAALGPLVCSALGEKANWHAGFAAAGFGMVLGLLQYRITGKHLGESGVKPGNTAPLSSVQRGILASVLVLGAAGLVLSLFGGFRLNPVSLARGTTSLIVVVAVVYFAGIYAFGRLDRLEKRRVGVIIVLFISSAIFWAGFEQMGSSFNLFAERYTLRTFANLTIPAGWFQSLGPVFIITLAPVVAWVWVRLAARKFEPSLGTKFGVALIFLAGGFAVMSGAAAVVTSGQKAFPTWLITTYLLHTIGELCLSPVGLSAVTKLAPQRLVGQLMGTWFLATSLGNLIAGLLAGRFDVNQLQNMPEQFFQMAWMPLGAGVLLIAFAKPLRSWMGGIK
jgi:POT family proton-dependent oligopeptide transporter